MGFVCMVGGALTACGDSTAPTTSGLQVEIRSVVPADSVFALDPLVLTGTASAPDLGVLPDDSLWWTENGTVIDTGSVARVRAMAGTHPFVLHARYGARSDSASRTLDVLSEGLGRVVWRLPLDSASAASLALSPDGVLYTTENDGSVIVAVGTDGSVRWRREMGRWWNYESRPPAIGPDGGLFYAPAVSPVNEGNVKPGGVWALNPDGTTRWTFATADYGPPGSNYYLVDGSVAVDAKGRVFFSSEEADVPIYAVSPAGALLWRTPILPGAVGYAGTRLWSFTALAGDSLVLSLPDKDSLPVLSAGSGKPRWWANSGSPRVCALGPAVDAKGNIYIPQFGTQSLEVYGPDGALRWSRALPAPVFDGEPIVGAKRVYFGSGNGGVLVLSTGGDSIAAYGPAFTSEFRDGLTLGADGVTYVAALDTLFSYDAAGHQRFATPIPHHPPVNNCWSVQGGPVIGAAGTVFVRASDYGVIAIRDTVGPATDAPWPTLQGSFLRAGRRATDYK